MPDPTPTAVAFATHRQPWWRRRPLLIGLIVFLLLCLGGPYAYIAIVAELDLREAIAEADRSDPGWRLLELEAKRVVIPAEQNSAVNLMNAKTLLPPKWPTWEDRSAVENRGKLPVDFMIFAESFDHLEPEAQLDDRQIAALRKELKRAEAALAEVYKIEDKPRGRFPVTYPKDFISYSSSGARDTRHLADLFVYDILLRCQDQDPEGAMKACHCLIHAQRAIGDEPSVISMLVRMAIRSLVFKEIKRILAQCQPSEASLATMQRLLEEEASEPLYLIGSRGDRGLMDGFLAALESGDATLQDCRWALDRSREGAAMEAFDKVQFRIFPSAAKTQRAALLRYNNQVVQFAKLSLTEQRTRLTATEPNAEELPWLAHNLAQSWRKIGLAFHRNIAELRCTLALLACERYRREQNRWPERLDDLVPRYLAEVPTDPFADAPLRFRRTKDGIMIYSVGYDGQDNGGKLENNGVIPGTDLGVRLWNVAKRRQPAKAQ